MDVGKDNVMHCGKDGGEDSGDAQMNEVRVFGVKLTLFFHNETLPNKTKSLKSRKRVELKLKR